MAKNPEVQNLFKKGKSFASKDLNLSIFLNYISSVLVISQAWFLSCITNKILFDNQHLSQLYPYLAYLFFTFLLRFGLSHLASFFGVRAVAKIKQNFRDKIFAKIAKSRPNFILSHGTGALINNLTDGPEVIGKYYSEFLPSKALVSYLPISILLFVVPIDWVSALIMLLTAPLIPIFMVIIGKNTEKLSQKQWQELARMSNHFLDVVQGLMTLKLFNASKREAKKISEISEDYRRKTMDVLKVAFLSSVVLEFFSTISIAIIAVSIGFRLMWGEMNFLSGFFILLLVPEFYQPLRKMGAAHHAKMEATAVAEKISLIVNQTDNVGKECVAKNFVAKSIAIRFENVSFAYGDLCSAVKNINFTIKSNSKVALVGPSGAGKSTIMALLLGFISKNEGKILINDQEIAQIEISQLRKLISWIPQSPTLFYGSIIDNIRFGDQNASDQDVINLCQKLGIDDFIQKLPNGYETIVGEKGYGLSGGQIQRIAIARAFLRDAPLILMDEPTASLDRQSEEILYQAINKIAQGKTIITIAHRLNTIENADEILFVKNGSIIDQGTHQYLKTKNKDYEKLVSLELIAKNP